MRAVWLWSSHKVFMVLGRQVIERVCWRKNQHLWAAPVTCMANHSYSIFPHLHSSPLSVPLQVFPIPPSKCIHIWITTDGGSPVFYCPIFDPKRTCTVVYISLKRGEATEMWLKRKFSHAWLQCDWALIVQKGHGYAHTDTLTDAWLP